MPDEPRLPSSMRPVPPPPPAALKGRLRPEQLPGAGRPPLPTGSPVVSDYTRAQLSKLGWNEDDPIPPNFAVHIKALQEEYANEQAAAEKANHEAASKRPALAIRNIDVDALPPAAKAELARVLKDYKQQVVAEQEAQLAIAQTAAQNEAAGVPPQVAAGLNEMAEVAALHTRAAQRQQRGNIDFIDDRPPPGAPPVPEGKTYAGTLGGSSDLAEQFERAKAAQAEAQRQQPAQPPPPPLPETGALPALTHCQRCKFPLDRPWSIQATDADKDDFMLASMTLKRYTKAYPLMGGRVIVTMRSLLANEARALSRYLRDLVRLGEIAGDPEYAAAMAEFRLILSTQSVQANTVTTDMPTLAEFGAPARTAGRADFALMSEHFYANIAPTENMRRILGKTYLDFVGLTGILEDLVNDPSFYPGIGPHG